MTMLEDIERAIADLPVDQSKEFRARFDQFEAEHFDRALADKNYALLKDNPRHPSLQFKKVGRFWSGSGRQSLSRIGS